MARLFGTDGVRGIANTELSCELAFRLGQASAYVLASDVHRPTILVGRDTRLSGEMLESALVAGICSVGARAVLVEVLPTPAIAYLTRFYEADAGAVISASHNTVEYNGIKFFDKNGYKLPDAIEDRIEEIVTGGMPTDFEMPIGERVGRPRAPAQRHPPLCGFCQRNPPMCGWTACTWCWTAPRAQAMRSRPWCLRSWARR